MAAQPWRGTPSPSGAWGCGRRGVGWLDLPTVAMHHSWTETGSQMTATGISMMHAGPNQGAFGTGIDHTARCMPAWRCCMIAELAPTMYWRMRAPWNNQQSASSSQHMALQPAFHAGHQARQAAGPQANPCPHLDFFLAAAPVSSGTPKWEFPFWSRTRRLLQRLQIFRRPT
eukprot:COSAG01_NODE_5667_length_4111_cov_6.282154_5_plen_172_part_00